MRRCVRAAPSGPPNHRQGGLGGRHRACRNRFRVAGADVYGTETEDPEDSKSLDAGPRPRFNSAHPQPLSASVAKSAFTCARLWIDACLLGSILSLKCLDHQAKRNCEAGTALGPGQVLRASVHRTMQTNRPGREQGEAVPCGASCPKASAVTAGAPSASTCPFDDKGQFHRRPRGRARTQAEAGTALGLGQVLRARVLA